MTSTFTYKVRDASDNIITGTVEGETERIVAESLRDRGYRPIEITPAAVGMNTEIKIPGFGNKVKLKELAVFCRQFATMINAAVPMLEALTVMQEQTDNDYFRKIIGKVRSTVESGLPLSTAMAEHPKVFPIMMTSMIKAGESSDIVAAMQRIADNYESEARLKGKIKAALAYPVVVFSLSMVMCLIMLIFVVPVFAKMFKSLGGTLPFPTQMLVDMSNILSSFWYILLGLFVGSIYAAKRYRLHPSVRAVIDPFKLKAPVFGALNRKLSISRFTRNFAGLYASGVPIQDCLDLSADASGNLIYAEILHRAKDVIQSGKALSAGLAGNKFIPSMVVQMVRVGEDSGHLDEMMNKVADFYDEEVEAATEALTSMIEPLMIAVLGAIIGTMLVALYMPIFKIYNLVN